MLFGKKNTRKNRYKKRPRSGKPGAGAWCLLKVVGGSLAVMGLSALLVMAHALFTQADYYRAKQLPVSGNQRLSVAAVLAQAGLAAGVQILDLNLGVVHNRLVAHPWIAQAQVSLEIPSTLRVTIREHRPLAVMDMRMGRRYLLNADGRLFKKWDATDPENLPVVTGLGYRDLPMDDEAGTKPFKAVLSLLTETGAWEALSLSKIEADPETGLTLVVAHSGQQIRMGYGHYTEKLSRLTALQKRLKDGNLMHDFASIDVSDLERIVVAPTGGSGDQQRS